MIKRLLFLCLILFMISCTTLDDGVQLFYMGEEKLQYFFPNRVWSLINHEEQEKIQLEADWLYRSYPLDSESEARTILNFSVFSTEHTIREKPSSIILQSSSAEITIPNSHISIIFIDRGEIRYNAWIRSDEMQELMSAGVRDDWKITLGWEKKVSFQSSENFYPQQEYFHEVILE